MSRNTEFIPFARPVTGAAEEAAVLRVLKSGWLTTGMEAQELERSYAQAAGRRHAVAVSSATAGLHLVCEALSLPAGSRVAMSPYTFTASAEILRYLNLHPKFVDIDPETLQMDPRALEAQMEADQGIGAIMAIHIAGLPSDMAAIRDVARRNEVPVVEDAAHCLPKAGDTAVPDKGSAAAVFSLYATKPVTAGEGGLIVTDRDDLAERARVMRLHGIDRDVWRRYTDKAASWMYDVVDAGYKYNLPDLLAAVGRVQLESAEARRARRREIARRYNHAFEGRDFLKLPPDHRDHDWHLYVVRLKEARLRDIFVTGLAEAGVGTSVHYIPLHHFTYYRNTYGLSPEDFPEATRAFHAAVSLPLHAGLTDGEVDRVIAAVLNVGHTLSRRFRRVPGE
ncbi:MAG: DegT/DnrJ/EryC1/StrS family aminotransferase [bacterium]